MHTWEREKIDIIKSECMMSNEKDVIDLVNDDDHDEEEGDVNDEAATTASSRGNKSSSFLMERWLGKGSSGSSNGEERRRRSPATCATHGTTVAASPDSSPWHTSGMTTTGNRKKRQMETENNALRKLLPPDRVERARKCRRIPEVRPPLTSTSLCYEERVLPRGLCLRQEEARPSRITSSESVARQRTEAEYPPLARGMLLWRKYLSPEFQQELLQTFDEVHSRTPAYIPKIYIYDKPCFQNVYSLRYV